MKRIDDEAFLKALDESKEQTARVLKDEQDKVMVAQVLVSYDICRMIFNRMVEDDEENGNG